MYHGVKRPAGGRQIEQVESIVDRPIFIVGAGRSGSTLFHHLFSAHPDVAWQSPLCNLFPAHPGLNGAFLRATRLPVLGEFLMHRLRPGERYRYWEHYCHGFARPCRDLCAGDVTPVHRWTIPPALARLATPHRRRVLIKITGWPRIGFLRELFPHAKFIHVYRDGRAVAGSLLAVKFWRGWSGPAQWGFGELSPSQRSEWESHDRSFVALAGIQWKLLMAAMEAASRGLPAETFMQVRYEDFVDDPVASFQRVAAFCELDWSTRFERSISRHRLRTANDKWKENLTVVQQEILERVLAEMLQRYGYRVGG